MDKLLGAFINKYLDQLDYNDLSEELLFRTMADSMGRQIDLFSGTRKLSLSGIGWDVHTVKISSNGPLPMQINSIIISSKHKILISCAISTII